MVRKDAEGDFIRKSGLKLAGAGGNLIVLTASGKQLGGTNGQNSDVVQAWREWMTLPASERAAGTLDVGPRGPVDAEHAMPEPPEGALVLKEYYRTLGRGSVQELRHVSRPDFVASLQREPQGHPRMFADLCISNPTVYEAQPDFVWLTRAEWQSLLPVDPLPGQRSRVPGAIERRIVRYHLDPVMAFGESLGWQQPKDVPGSALVLTVVYVTANRVRLRLDGHAILGPDPRTARARIEHKQAAYGYEARLLGYIEYDPRNKVIDRLDVLALGDTYGMLPGDLRFYSRPGREPLGASFELVDPAVPANRVPPRGAASPDNCRNYLGLGR
jgi:hypothetical protein